MKEIKKPAKKGNFQMKKFFTHCLILTFLINASNLLAEPQIRPAKWAQPMIGSSLKNWHQLDKKLYRSSQPSKEEFQEIESFGISAVLNLRKHHSAKDEALNTKLKLYSIPMEADELSYEDLVKALRIIAQEKGSILVHCWHGSDRTGAICAAYRIVFQNWTKEEAITEMMLGGYGFHSMFDNIPQLIKNIDVEELKKDINQSS